MKYKYRLIAWDTDVGTCDTKLNDDYGPLYDHAQQQAGEESIDWQPWHNDAPGVYQMGTVNNHVFMIEELR